MNATVTNELMYETLKTIQRDIAQTRSDIQGIRLSIKDLNTGQAALQESFQPWPKSKSISMNAFKEYSAGWKSPTTCSY